MATVNPFYRFEDAAAVNGFGSRARALSIATDELSSTLNQGYNGQSIFSVIQYFWSQLAFVNAEFSANFIVEYIPNSNPNFYPSTAQVFIYDSGLIRSFPLCKISIVFELDNSNIVTNSAVTFLGILPNNFNYSAPLLEGEKRAHKSLINYYENGDSIFPLYYKFNSQTGVATSFIARFKDCQYSPLYGSAIRVPADLEPRGNAYIKRFGELNKSGKYVISLFDQLIYAATLDGVTYADLLAIYLNWNLPSGYSTTYYQDFVTANRLQINIFSPSSDGYVLILREDNGFLFQRFYTPNYSETNILFEYDPALELPYEPDLSAIRYENLFYDFDLCEFVECVIPQKEVYPMPSVSGDIYQFNILPQIANVATDTLVNVGLFDTNNDLVYRIGTARPLQTAYTVTSAGFYIGSPTPSTISQWVFSLGMALLEPMVFFLTDCDGQPVSAAIATIAGGTITSNDEAEFIAAVEASLPDWVSVQITFDEGIPTFVWTIYNAPECFCGIGFYTENPSESTWIGTVNAETINQTTQMQAQLTIPAVDDGCYRLGLYRQESNYDGLSSLFEPQTISANNYFFAIVDGSNVPQYLIAIPNSADTWAKVCEWAVDNLPFANVVFDNISQNLTIELYPYLNLSGFTIELGEYNFNTSTWSGFTFTGDTLPPLSELNISEIYSLSNPIDLDNSDCFSTILQYWSQDNSIAEGFEYYNNWHQQVRLGINGGGQKPVITDSTYRQSNGIHRRPQNKQDLTIDLHTDFLDFETQTALVDATRHTFFVVDNRNLFVNTEIEVATVQDFTTQSSFEDLAQVKFSALVQGYQPKNSTCINC